MADMNITQILPAELLARIFSFLPEQYHVSSCRLVCRTFHELSSPFLIPQLVFALRLDTLARMREIIEHPYFSKHVTHLVYDASRYSAKTAVRWNEYVHKCEQSPRNLVDRTWVERQEKDASILDSLSNLDIGDGRLGQSVSPAPSDQATDEGDELVAGDISDGSDDEESEDELPGMDEYYATVYKMGCQRTFPDYYARSKAQETLLEEGYRLRMLRAAFTRCPKLRNVIYTDYRGLARHGESFIACCERLFGLTLEPEHMVHLAETTMTDLNVIFDAAHAVGGARIKSLEIPPHPFTSSEAAMSGDIACASMPARITLSKSVERYISRLLSSFGGLHTLALAYYVEARPVLSQLLAPAASNLRRLSISRYSDNIYGSPETFEGDNDFLGMTFPRLEYVDLRHLHLPDARPLQDFLERHAVTLREVRLINCCVSDRASEQYKLATWAGQNMSLTGVEIITSSDTRVLARRRNCYMDQLKTVSEVESRENLWLGGRPNSLKRSVAAADRERRQDLETGWTLRKARLY